MDDMAAAARAGGAFLGKTDAWRADDRSAQQGPGAERNQMKQRTRDVPETVHKAAASAWGKWKDRISATRSAVGEADEAGTNGARRIDADANKTPEQKIIEKIKLRMSQYPEWYETDPEKVAATVAAELERIGAVLDHELANAKEAVEVWQVPLSVFNWLIETAHGESFVHGALKAWSSAENFNAANAAGLDDDQRAKLRAPFLELAPMLLRVVLEEMLETDLVITFAEKFVGPEPKYLVMRVENPAPR